VACVTVETFDVAEGGVLKRYFTALVTVLLGASLVLGAASFLHSANHQNSPVVAEVRGTAQTAEGVLPHAFINLSTYPDSLGANHGADGGVHPDWVSYGPSTDIRLPAHALVTFTITQYDSGGTLNNPYFAKVAGTVATPGNGTKDGEVLLDGKPVSSIDPTAVGHTFTIHELSSPSQKNLFVNVPLPAVADDAVPETGYTKTPHVITFSFVTDCNGTCHYVWNCEYPCGDGTYRNFGDAMSTRGFMSGTITVA
jgi:hypothetical protein